MMELNKKTECSTYLITIRIVSYSRINPTQYDEFGLNFRDSWHDQYSCRLKGFELRSRDETAVSLTAQV